MPVNGGARNGVTNVLASQTHHDGAHALAFPALIDLTNTYNASVMVPICTGGTINLSGYTMSAWIYVTGTNLGTETFLFFDAWGPSGMISSPALMGEKLNTLNTWQQATITFSSSVQADHVSIRLNDPPGWTGTVYVDSVTITPCQGSWLT